MYWRLQIIWNRIANYACYVDLMPTNWHTFGWEFALFGYWLFIPSRLNDVMVIVLLSKNLFISICQPFVTGFLWSVVVMLN